MAKRDHSGLLDALQAVDDEIDQADAWQSLSDAAAALDAVRDALHALAREVMRDDST